MLTEQEQRYFKISLTYIFVYCVFGKAIGDFFKRNNTYILPSLCFGLLCAYLLRQPAFDPLRQFMVNLITHFQTVTEQAQAAPTRQPAPAAVTSPNVGTINSSQSRMPRRNLRIDTNLPNVFTAIQPERIVAPQFSWPLAAPKALSEADLKLIETYGDKLVEAENDPKQNKSALAVKCTITLSCMIYPVKVTNQNKDVRYYEYAALHQHVATIKTHNENQPGKPKEYLDPIRNKLAECKIEFDAALQAKIVAACRELEASTKSELKPDNSKKSSSWKPNFSTLFARKPKQPTNTELSAGLC